MNATIRINVETNSSEELEEALERLRFIREGLMVESTYWTRKRGKLWFAEVLITATPDAESEPTHE